MTNKAAQLSQQRQQRSVLVLMMLIAAVLLPSPTLLSDPIERPRRADNNNKNWTQLWLEEGTKGEKAQFLFVHVGKTGGTSFRDTLYGTKPPPALEQHLVTTTHTGVVGHKEDKETKDRTDLANTFLFTIRPPISRIVSAFNFHRKLTVPRRNVIEKNETSLLISNPRFDYNLEANGGCQGVFYFDCFRTIEDVAEVLLLPPSEVVDNKGLRVCRDIAHKVLAGVAPAPASSCKLEHFTFNYQYNVNCTIMQRPELPVVAIRMDHLEQDSKKLDVALGGTGELEMTTRTHGSEDFVVQSGLESTEHKRVVCCALSWQELDAYQTIVLRALNLDSTEKRELLQESMAECGVVRYHSDPVYEPFSWRAWHEKSCGRFHL